MAAAHWCCRGRVAEAVVRPWAEALPVQVAAAALQREPVAVVPLDGLGAVEPLKAAQQQDWEKRLALVTCWRRHWQSWEWAAVCYWVAVAAGGRHLHLQAHQPNCRKRWVWEAWQPRCCLPPRPWVA